MNKTSPPRESIGHRLLKYVKLNFTDNKRCLDFMMASVIFIVTILEFISWRLSVGEQAVIADHGNEYMTFYYPLMASITQLVFALFFLIKIFRYRACVYTELITLVYFFIQVFNLSAYLIQFGADFYDRYIYPTFLFTIIGITIIKIVRWLSKLPKQQS